jgi:hypothetical protein
VPAFTEDLTAKYKTVILVRQGPEARSYGDDWRHQCVVCSNDGETADILGLAPNPSEPESSLSNTAFREAIAVIKSLGFRVLSWTRKKAAGDRDVTVA